MKAARGGLLIQVWELAQEIQLNDALPLLLHKVNNAIDFLNDVRGLQLARGRALGSNNCTWKSNDHRNGVSRF